LLENNECDARMKQMTGLNIRILAVSASAFSLVCSSREFEYFPSFIKIMFIYKEKSHYYSGISEMKNIPDG
jgi:hypothetical protein